MHVAVIANPASSRGGGAKHRERLRTLLEAAGLEYEIIETTSPGAAIRTGRLVEGGAGQLARQAALQGASIVAAAGGDGTIGEVANGLLGTNAILGLLPMGTGNDFCRSIGIGTDLELAVRTLALGHQQEIDVAKIDGGGHYINVAGTGFDAEVARRINEGYRFVRGTTAYVLAALQTLKSYKAAQITLDIDGKLHEEKAMLCAIANATSYGGGMRIAPMADLTDGMLDVVIVGDVSRAEFLRSFPSVFKGTHIAHPKVKHYRGKVVSVAGSRSMPALADGEEVGTLPLTVRISPEKLNILVP